MTVSQVNPFTVGGQTVANPITAPASNEELTSQVVGPGGKVISVPNLPGNIPSISTGFESASQIPGETQPNIPPLIPVNPNAVGQLTPTTTQPNVPFPVSTSPVVGTELHADRIFTPDTETPDSLPSPHNLVRGKTDPSPLATLERQSASTSNSELAAIARQVQGLLQTHSDQMAHADAIFNSARDNVKTFLKVIDQNQTLSKSVYAATLSKQEQDAFAATMADLRQRLGLTGGSYVSASQDPTTLDSSDKSQLLNKLMNAGLTI
ncbi:MAG: hypothetical protein JO308_09650 [Verrucomicrobia bacterium]|nr:hypothetical protein [Verrucomicrobiota bacterium]